MLSMIVGRIKAVLHLADIALALPTERILYP